MYFNQGPRHSQPIQATRRIINPLSAQHSHLCRGFERIMVELKPKDCSLTQSAVEDTDPCLRDTASCTPYA